MEVHVEMAVSQQQRSGRLSRRRVWLFAILALVGVVVVLVGIKGAQIATLIKAGKSFVIPPESVTTTKVLPLEWQSQRETVGTLVAVQAVTVASEVPGLVKEIGFDSGTFLRRGDVMVRLDSSVEEAQLQAAKADAELAKATLERAKALRESKTNSPADLDAADARAKQTAANVATLQASLAKRTIRAPFDGRVAIRQVNLGQVLAAGTAVASLQSVTPIYADFWLPQQALAELQVGMQARLRTDVFPKASWEGKVTTINPEVDVATRNVRVRATFPNADGRLRPGMFVNVDVLSPERRSVLAIPSTAVLYAPFGDSVFAVEEKKDDEGAASLVARQKFVRLGERRGDLVAVTNGLSAGETIVSSGAFKLRNGAAVVVHNELAPKAEIAPTPVDQ
ncbi:MAG TPA: efflux RND transporter periplasmic adaptor subunit [Myxococcales bacterium]|nr:efflux RND transporter periplasmic adaptor subunit [Myxococcales bacterium]